MGVTGKQKKKKKKTKKKQKKNRKLCLSSHGRTCVGNIPKICLKGERRVYYSHLMQPPWQHHSASYGSVYPVIKWGLFDLLPLSGHFWDDFSSKPLN